MNVGDKQANKWLNITNAPVRQNVGPNCIINGQCAVHQGERNIYSKVNPNQGLLQNALMEIESSIQAAATAHWDTKYSLENMTTLWQNAVVKQPLLSVLYEFESSKIQQVIKKKKGSQDLRN